ncbi:hypothetical protein [Mesorhizobium sp. LNHC209A00]|uniref:hypothetical protein n=1 Tax=Mesorhizobium TaxID=68287 RepID=UPI0003D00B5F|nr:hypothetical protein [Mesorhizobium sp. LNHC209A00]ESY94391.1 hypothetical protein X738_24775 [Mesorhizobium sp. LNHC209A00]
MMIAPVIFALLLGVFIFVVLPHAGIARRTLSVGIFLALITVVYVGASELLGRPKPLTLEWRDTAKAQVVGAVPVENEAIYVWLITPVSTEPRFYVLPWSQQAAQQLQDAMGKAEADGTGVEMKMQTTDAGLNARAPMFYARPQPPLPAKDYQSGERPLVYARPTTSADATR